MLAGCLQRDPRKRPSLPDLLNHAFLQTREMVSREALARALSAVMAGVGSSFCSEVLGGEAVDPPSEQEWHVLVDEVWDNLCSGGVNPPGGSLPSEAALAPLWRHLRRCTNGAAVDPPGMEVPQQQRKTASATLRPNTAANFANATVAAKATIGEGALLASGGAPGGCGGVLSTTGKENARSAPHDRAVQPPRIPQRPSEQHHLQVPSACQVEGELRRDLWR